MIIDKFKFFQNIGYTPHSEAQRLYHLSRARFRVACCGRRFGKSTMAARDLEPEFVNPTLKHRYWIVGPTYDLGEKEFRVLWDDLIIKMGLGKDKRVKRSYNKRSGEMYIEMPWGTRVEVRSATHPETLVGDSLDGVIMSEAAKHKLETWERFIRASLADRRGWATFPTTPEGHNWLYDLWQFGQNPDLPHYESWRFPSWDNPIVYPGGREDPEIKQIELTTSYEWFQQEIAADFTSFVGRIYGEFDETTHVKKHTFNPDWPNFVFMDWGFVQPFAAIEAQIDPQDNVYIWRQYYKSYETLEQSLMNMRFREQPEGYHVNMCFGDAADPSAALYVSQHFAPCLAMPEAKENWRDGINLVKKFLKPYQIGIVDEFGTPLTRPKLFVDHSCVDVIREFNLYRADDNVTSRTRESGAQSAAQKQDDHALDAIRYGLVHIFKLGAHKNSLESVVSFEELETDEEPFFSLDYETDLGSSDGFFSLNGTEF